MKIINPSGRYRDNHICWDKGSLSLVEEDREADAIILPQHFLDFLGLDLNLNVF